MTSRGKHKVLMGVDYRVGDGWSRAEPGDVIENLDDVTDGDYRALRELGAIEPVRPARPRASATTRRNP